VPSEEQIEALRRLHKETRIPPSERVGKLPRGGTQLDFMGHADVTDVLLEHDPAWTWEPMAKTDAGEPVISTDVKGNPALWAWLTIHGVTRPAVGTCTPNVNDPLKELVSDMLRNGAMRAGVALSLWSKEEWTDGSAPKKTARASKKPEEATAPTPPAAAPPAADTPVEERQNSLVERIKSLGVDQRASLREWMGRENIPEKPSALTVENIVAIEQYIHMLGDTF
jgi:hypothetical protein